MKPRPPIRMPEGIAEFIRTLHPQIKKRIHAGLEDLRIDQAGGKALRDELEGYRSLRVGRLRIVYRVNARKEIEVVAVGPRRTIYEEAARLLAKQDR
jgi:mRNA-degrading endonuclease RelE of RelBE toxin-antitoxin system